jgi:ABC-type bacteriocin/lantibiotic exporter with double-glycine peptidase domain
LRGVSFSMPVGKITVLSGPTGSGKTTVADVLSGLLYPADGSVLVDGQAVSRRDIPGWRRHVGYVDQEATLFSGTVQDNLIWGMDSVDEHWKEIAISTAMVTEFLSDLPAGLDSQVGERGSRLSGGQRQRIAIARELIRKPALLILDEATSGLDETTEARLIRRLTRLDIGLTVLLISHRRSALEYGDAVVSLERGRVTSITDNGQPASSDRHRHTDPHDIGCEASA